MNRRRQKYNVMTRARALAVFALLVLAATMLWRSRGGTDVLPPAQITPAATEARTAAPEPTVPAGNEVHIEPGLPFLLGNPALDSSEIDVFDLKITVLPAFEAGTTIGEVSLERIGLSYPVKVGTDVDSSTAAMRRAACLLDYGTMGLPGGEKWSYLAGHNYAEFNKLKSAEVGDMIELRLDYGVFEYTVREIVILAKTESELPSCDLVVYTCYPYDQGPGTTRNAYFICDLVSSARIY